MNAARNISTAPAPAADAARLVAKQRTFFASGVTLSADFRRQQLKRLLYAVRKQEAQLHAALMQDFRKPEFEAFVTETGIVIQELKVAIRQVQSWAKPRKVPGTIVNFPASDRVYPEPYGVSLIISPWNYPVQLLLNPLVASIAAGNCCILKPSELAPATAALIQGMITDIFPEEYIAVRQGDAATTEALLQQRFDHIFFTGSTAVGRKVMQAAATHLTPVVLELGGKSPCIVTASADIQLAAKRIAWGKFINAGQTCIAPDYVLVQEEVKEPLLEALRKTIRSFYGEDVQRNGDYPRIINRRHFDRITRMITPGHVYAGGVTDAADLYIAPTLLYNIDRDHASMQEEIFGPVLPVIGYKSLELQLQELGRQEKPLALYLFSNNKKEQQQVLQQCHFGGGCVNDTVSHIANGKLPFGGVGNSGMGSYHGRYGFEAFSHFKSVTHRGSWPDVPLRYPPYGDKLSWLRKLYQWL